jgi:hypothetical protein
MIIEIVIGFLGLLVSMVIFYCVGMVAYNFQGEHKGFFETTIFGLTIMSLLGLWIAICYRIGKYIMGLI